MISRFVEVREILFTFQLTYALSPRGRRSCSKSEFCSNYFSAKQDMRRQRQRCVGSEKSRSQNCSFVFSKPNQSKRTMIKPAQLNKNANKRRGNAEQEFPVAPVIIQSIRSPRGFANHSYRDFSNVPPQKGYEHPKEIKEMTFSQKVHHILSTPEYEKWISWMPHGRSFKVHVPVMFEAQVCPKYFDHKRYSSFLRELNNYGFKHVSKGTDRNSKWEGFWRQWGSCTSRVFC